MPGVAQAAAHDDVGIKRLAASPGQLLGIPADGGEIIAGGFVEQTETVIENIVAVLASAGCGLEDVVKVNAWLDDPRDFTSFNEVVERRFRANRPARSTVQSALMVDARVELDVIACKPER